MAGTLEGHIVHGAGDALGPPGVRERAGRAGPVVLGAVDDQDPPAGDPVHRRCPVQPGGKRHDGLHLRVVRDAQGRQAAHRVAQEIDGHARMLTR